MQLLRMFIVMSAGGLTPPGNFLMPCFTATPPGPDILAIGARDAAAARRRFKVMRVVITFSPRNVKLVDAASGNFPAPAGRRAKK